MWTVAMVYPENMAQDLMPTKKPGEIPGFRYRLSCDSAMFPRLFGVGRYRLVRPEAQITLDRQAQFSAKLPQFGEIHPAQFGKTQPQVT